MIFELCAGLVIAAVLLIQWWQNKRKRSETAEIVILEDGKLHTSEKVKIGLKKNYLLIIGLLFIVGFGGVYYWNYSISQAINILSQEDKYEEADQVLYEAENSFLPLFNKDEIEFDLNYSWGMSSFDLKEWEAAIIKLERCKKIKPDEFVNLNLFAAYCEVINSKLPPYYTRNANGADMSGPFDEFYVLYGSRPTPESYNIITYRQKLTNIGLDSSLINRTYELYKDALEANSEYATFIIAKYIRRKELIIELLNSNNIDLITDFYVAFSKDPRVAVIPKTEIVYRDSLNSFLSERIDFTDSLLLIIANRELYTYILVDYLKDDPLLFSQYGTLPDNYTQEEITQHNLYTALKNAKRFKWSNSNITALTVKLLDNQAYSRPSQIEFIKIIEMMESQIDWDSVDPFIENEIIRVSKLKESLSDYFIVRNSFDHEGISLEGIFNARVYNELRYIYTLAGRLSEQSGQLYVAIRNLDKALQYSKVNPKYTSFLDEFNGGYIFGLGGDWILHEYTADQILSLRARCKWNIIPYGTKLGYCDDMRRALELNPSPSDDQFATYNKDCN